MTRIIRWPMLPALLCTCVALWGCQGQKTGSSNTPALFFPAQTVLPDAFGADSPRDPRDDRSVNTYPITVTMPQVLLVGASSAEIDTYLEVVDDQGQVVAADDDNGPDVDAYLAVPVTPGTYRVRVFNTVPQSQGGYLWGYSLVTPLWIQAENGTLATGDQQHPDDQSWMDTFSVTGQARQTLLMEMSSVEFTSFIQLVSPTGEGVAIAPARRKGSTVLLAVYLEQSGTYTIRATAAKPGMTGSYTLRYDLSPKLS